MSFELFKKQYFSAGVRTDPGLLRHDNQDAYQCCPGSGLFVVSDGMGGGDGGEVASRIVTDVLGKAAWMPGKDLSYVVDLCSEASRTIAQYAAKHCMRGMGATIVGIILAPFHPEEALLFSAGDSRCYRLRDHQLQQLTTDHTVAEAVGIPEEKLAPQLRSVLTNAAGCGPNFFAEAQSLEIRSGDIYLLCSDGISRQVPDSEITEKLQCGASPREKADALVEASLRHGGNDNATALVVEFGTIPAVTDDVLREEASCPDRPEGEEEDHATPPTE